MTARRAAAPALAALLALAAPVAAQDLAALRALYDYDARRPLDAKLTLVRRQGGAAIYDLAYASPIAGTVTAFLVLPEGAGLKPPFAGIVFGHWGPGNRGEFLPEATMYAEAGAVSVLIDYPWVRPAPHRRAQGRGRARLGYVGHSYGAQWGAILSAVDKRMKATVLVGGVPDQESLLDGPDPDVRAIKAAHTPEEYEAYMALNRPFDAIRYIGQAAPVPLLFQFARHETSFVEADMKRYYDAASQPKEVRWYETGHDLNDLRTLADRAAWLGPKLGLRPLRPVFEQRLNALP